MSSSVPYHFTTGAGNSLQPVGSADQTANLKGIVVANTAAYTLYVKLCWFPNTASASAPTVGTTAPNFTYAAAPSSSNYPNAIAFPDGVTGNGQMWVWVTKAAGDTDNTSTLANDGVITLLVE